MLLPNDIIPDVKKLLKEMGADWGPHSTNKYKDRPVCIGIFRSWVIAIYDDGTQINEIRALGGNVGAFDEFLQEIIRPVDPPPDENPPEGAEQAQP